MLSALSCPARRRPASGLTSLVRFVRRPALNQSQLTEGRRTGALALKVGMMPVFDRWGKRYPCTVLHVDGCRVIQAKTVEDNGYTALQLGAGDGKRKRFTISELGHFDKAGVNPKRNVQEFRVTPDMSLPVGSTIHARHFVPGQLVDISGITKGKGYQGVMKLHNFGGGRATHGNSLTHRSLGSTGQRQDPGRVFKGKKMPGRMGSDRVTVQNLKIIKIDPARELIYVFGSVPGNPGVYLRVTDAVKGPFFPSPPPTPTYKPTDGEDLSEIFAPTSDVDEGKQVDHPDPVQYL